MLKQFDESLGRSSLTMDDHTVVLTSGNVVVTFLAHEIADPDRALVGTKWTIESLITASAVSSVSPKRLIDTRFAKGDLDEPASIGVITWIHREFYRDAEDSMVMIDRPGGVSYRMEPGVFRTRPDQDILVGCHQPPSSVMVSQFMDYFELGWWQRGR